MGVMKMFRTKRIFLLILVAKLLGFENISGGSDGKYWEFGFRRKIK